MKFSFLLFACFLTLSLAHAEPPGKGGPCREDLKKFCPDVKPGGGAVYDCMKKNEAQLSASCKQHMTQMSAKIRPMMHDVRTACQQDSEKFCKDVAPGKGSRVKCLYDNMNKPDFSPACKAQIEKMKEMRQQMRQQAAPSSKK